MIGIDGGWVLALLPGVALAAGGVRARGRRRRLNRALHELRRPLQTLALLGDPGPPASPGSAARRGLIQLATTALSDLERAVNGEPWAPALRPIASREIVLAALERWRAATDQGVPIKLFWDAGAGVVDADPARLAQALDNLFANALDHGGPPLTVTGSRVAGKLRITVSDSGSHSSPPTGDCNPSRSRRRRDPRRGHGIEIVSQIAASHGGRFALARSGVGCTAALELPLVSPSLPRAA